MNNLKSKLLLNLAKNKKDKGFTLIELLVVIIIIGVLSAVALPNLLGQVGKARESEAKNGVGSINRGQQSYFTEKSAFAPDTSDVDQIRSSLGVGIQTEFYEQISIGTTNQAAGDSDSTVAFANGQRINDGTRDYLGGIVFDQGSRAFSSVVCRTDDANATNAVAPSSDISVSNGTIGCAGQMEEVN